MTKKYMPDIDPLRPKGSKLVGRVQASVSSGHWMKLSQSKMHPTKTLERDPKSGRFSEGVQHVSVRDRAGLIKLADR